MQSSPVAVITMANFIKLACSSATFPLCQTQKKWIEQEWTSINKQCELECRKLIRFLIFLLTLLFSLPVTQRRWWLCGVRSLLELKHFQVARTRLHPESCRRPNPHLFASVHLSLLIVCICNFHFLNCCYEPLLFLTKWRRCHASTDVTTWPLSLTCQQANQQGPFHFPPKPLHVIEIIAVKHTAESMSKYLTVIQVWNGDQRSSRLEFNSIHSFLIRLFIYTPSVCYLGWMQ